jgi:hypothetical protein
MAAAPQLDVIPGRVEDANPESRFDNFWIPDRSEDGPYGMTDVAAHVAPLFFLQFKTITSSPG